METPWIWLAGIACTAHVLWTVALLALRSQRDSAGAIDRQTGRRLRFQAELRRTGRASRRTG